MKLEWTMDLGRERHSCLEAFYANTALFGYFRPLLMTAVVTIMNP